MSIVRREPRNMLVLLGVLSGLVGAACGPIGEEAVRELIEGGHKPGGGASQPTDPAAEAMIGDRRVPLIPDDVQFIDFFIPHHEMAVRMAEVELSRGVRAEVRHMAEMMKRSQLEDIAKMRAARRELTGDPEPSRPPTDWHTVVDETFMLTAKGEDVDRMFLEHMIPHHASGVPVAHRAKAHIEREDLRELAAKIFDEQAREIGEMKEALGESCPGTGGRPDCHNGAGDVNPVGDRRLPYTPADDVKFIDFFVPHHEMAVHMAELVIAKGSDSAVKSLARKMRDEQLKEIEEMQAARRELTGSAASPPLPPDPHAEAEMKEMEALAGRELDHHFVLEMIPHHAAGLPPAHRGRPRLRLEHLRELAHEIFDSQAEEVGELHELLHSFE